MSFFYVEHREKKARAGILRTAHSTIKTPAFMPVGTQGSVKTLDSRELREEVKTPIILANAYHLYLRPGTEILEEAGGLHQFMQWNGSILTDSGGFQVYSLAENRKIKPDGVEFKSHIDGGKHYFTPRKVVDIQRSIGSDIMMVLDECTPYPCEYGYAKKSLELTHSWAKISREHFKKTRPKYGFEQFQFGIVQGSVYEDLRKKSAEFIASLEFDGNAIGGLAVGEPAEMMYSLTEIVCEILPEDKPRYLMGVGTPVNLLESVARGVDMFDCVLPSRNARHGILYTKQGYIKITNAKFRRDFSPIDEQSDLPSDKIYSKAYLHHLFRAKEYLAYRLATLHNLRFFVSLLQEAREHILAATFYEWKEKLVPLLMRKL